MDLIRWVVKQKIAVTTQAAKSVSSKVSFLFYVLPLHISDKILKDWELKLDQFLF